MVSYPVCHHDFICVYIRFLNNYIESSNIQLICLSKLDLERIYSTARRNMNVAEKN